MIGRQAGRQADSQSYSSPILFFLCVCLFLCLTVIVLSSSHSFFALQNEWTALHRACIYGHTSTARALVKAGANVEAKDQYGETPLIRASIGGHLATVQFLAEECGADVETKNIHGWTALSQAKRYGKSDVEQYLLSKGASS